MYTPSFREDDSSQLPALRLLIHLGYRYLSPEEALAARGGKASGVLLDDILRTQLKTINAVRQISSTRATYLSDASIEKGVRVLKTLPFQEGYIRATEAAYDLLLYGQAVEQQVDGESKSFTLQYIDWNDWKNNVFHVTEEFDVLRSGGREHYRPDLVLFVNGIPLCVIECKRPDMKEPLKQAISQHIRNQQEDGIRHLYAYSQILLALAVFQNKYATTDTSEEYWAAWKEDRDPALETLVNTPLAASDMEKIFSWRTTWQRREWEEKARNQVAVSPQDEYLYHLCRPERLLALTRDYVLFEAGVVKKIARYQQYFAIERIVGQIRDLSQGKRKGGVVWHTQGSGKSLTMAMLARKIYSVVRNPKIVLVTDRVDLDTQITDTFRKVSGVNVQNAKTGSALVELLQSKSDAVVTTIINKFEAAVKQLEKTPLESPDIFVLIDEGHRTQYGTFNVKMQKVLPNACFLAFTGTPLMKKEKSTAAKFGGIIDTYTIRDAVADGAIVPILYEGRHALQDVNQKAIDRGFDRVAEGLSDQKTVDLKKKYSRSNLIAKTEQRIHEIAQDISEHFIENWGQDETGDLDGFKGMVVTPDKATAIRYKKAFDLIGKVSTEVVISAPDDREGNDSTLYAPNDEVVTFWKGMTGRLGKDFEKKLIEQFKKTDRPELLIVVDKLLTGFDVPRVIVMYVCRKLREHTLLQAVARVNRVAPGKEYGLIIDYEGILGELDEAMNLYTNLDEFDAGDLEDTFIDIRKEVEKLPDVHSALLDIFKALPNRLDLTSYTRLLEDEAVRTEFYQKFSAFGRVLKLAFASLEFDKKTDEKTKDRYRRDLKFFTELRNAVLQIHSETVDFKQYEKQLQKLLDQHVVTEEVIRLTDQVSILDTEAFEQAVARIVGDRARADTIASRTARHISMVYDEDPVFYKRLSELIQQTIADMRAGRLSEVEAVRLAWELSQQAISRKTEDTPEAFTGKEEVIPFYRFLKSTGQADETACIRFALETDEIIRKFAIVDWDNKPDIVRKMNFYVSEYLIDEAKMPIFEAEKLAEECVNTAKKRYRL